MRMASKSNESERRRLRRQKQWSSNELPFEGIRNRDYILIQWFYLIEASSCSLIVATQPSFPLGSMTEMTIVLSLDLRPLIIITLVSGRPRISARTLVTA